MRQIHRAILIALALVAAYLDGEVFVVVAYQCGSRSLDGAAILDAFHLHQLLDARISAPVS
jgi:hypothetical protein